MGKYKSQRRKKSGLIHYDGHCQDCDMEFSSANAVGLAARHTDATGHHTYVETGHYYSFFVVDEELLRKKS